MYSGLKLTAMSTRPDNISSHIYYKPTEEGNEAKLKHRLEYINEWKASRKD